MPKKAAPQQKPATSLEEMFEPRLSSPANGGRDFEVPAPDYTPEEMEYRSYLITRLSSARNSRDTTHMEFDDMNYITNYETNARAANSYIEPKKNKEDTRIVTGTTREKVNTLLSALLNYNLEAQIDAYDSEDMLMQQLGKPLSDMIRKSREMEDYDQKRTLIYRELLDQGDVFVEEVLTQWICVDKEVELNFADGIDPRKTSWKKKLSRIYERCEARLFPGTKVYLGNVKESSMHRQPYMFCYEIVSYEEARAVYAKWSRFKNVPRQVVHTAETSQNFIDYRNWSLFEVQNDTVEIIKYYDKWNNEMMIMLNGVMMLPIKFPLTAISPSGEYPMAKGSVEPIPFFAYSKSVPAKTKVDQAILDEFIKLVVLKTQQSYKPPMGNMTGRALSSNIYFPGKLNMDVNPDLLKPLVDARGVTDAEFNAFEFIKKIVDEKSVSPVFSGDQMQGNQTATQILEMKKQQMMKLGLVIFGVIAFEKDLAWLRLHNILKNWTKAIDKRYDPVTMKLQDVFRTITVKTDLTNGLKGRRVIKMDKGLTSAMTPEHIQAEEQFMSQDMPTEIVYFDPNELQQLEATFDINITPTEKNTSELRRMLFTQNIRDAAAIFGPQEINFAGLKDRFAILAGEDPSTFFIGQGGNQMPQGMPPGAPPGQQPAPNALPASAGGLVSQMMGGGNEMSQMAPNLPMTELAKR